MKHLSLATLTLTAALAVGACNDTQQHPPATATPSPPPVTNTPLPPATPPPTTPDTNAEARGKDTAASNPMGTLSKEQESSSMPMAGQANNHSSPSLEPGAKK